MTRANLVNGKWLPGYPVDVEHNHSALKNIEVLAYHNKYRKLNEEDQQKMFKILANTDASNTFIAASLTPLGSNLVLRVDIKNQKARLQQALNERDNNDKLRPLMQLLESNDYITSYEVDSENRLTHLFFAHSSAVELVRRHPDVLIVDTTYKTNLFDLPLMNSVGVSNVYGTHYGDYAATSTTRALKNFQIALAWSSDEETESYEWFLQKLKEKIYLNKEPEVIVTDRCQKVRNGVKAIFPDAGTLLCSWHLINKNLFENCRKHLGDKYDALDGLVRNMQSSCNEESLERARIEAFAFCDEHAATPAKSIECKKYVESLLKEKEHWVKFYVDQHLHLGTCTTGRVESQHSALKSKMTAIYSLEKAFKMFNNTIKGQFIDLTVQIGREKTRLPYFVQSTKQFDQMKRKVSHFAIDLIKGQIAKHHDEIREKIPKRPCTNYYQKIYRWPCRHMTDPENLDAVTSMYLIGKRWLLDEEIEHSADEEVPTTASQVISSSNMTM